MEFEIKISIDDSVTAEIAQAIAAKVADILRAQNAPTTTPAPTPAPAPAPAPAAPQAAAVPTVAESVKDRATKLIEDVFARLCGANYNERRGDLDVRSRMLEASNIMKESAKKVSAGKTMRPGELTEEQFARWAVEANAISLEGGKVVIDEKKLLPF